MGTSLNGLTPAGTYPGLIKTGDNAPIDGTLKTLSDGNGNNLPMAVSTTAVNFTNQLQQSGVAVPTASQVAAKQDTLVSGTNIKTINGTSVLGSGNIAVVTSPSGVAGAIQFSDGSAFASDASNLFWDDTNNRLGVGTNAPTNKLSINGTNGTGITLEDTGANKGSFVFQSGGTFLQGFNNGLFLGTIASPNSIKIDYQGFVGIGENSATARLHIKGSGSTSATTSLLVQNSAGVSSLQVTDDGSVFNYGKGSLTTNTAFGVSAIGGNNTAGNLTAFGRRALFVNTSGSSNSAFGGSALSSNTSGAQNTAIGVGALIANTTGSNNSSLGVDTSSGNFSGSVILGNEATATANNQFVVGSSTTNAGAVNSTSDVPATFLWSVRINGTNYKILMTT